jgi:phage terminase large subunit-like protein
MGQFIGVVDYRFRMDEIRGQCIPWNQLRGRDCYAGLDLAATEDVTAFVLVFPMDDGSIKVVPKLFVSVKPPLNDVGIKRVDRTTNLSPMVN